MTLADVVDAYLTRQRSLGMRFESAGQLLLRFSRAMGDRPIQEVTPEAIIAFLNGNGTLTATWALKHRVPAPSEGGQPFRLMVARHSEGRWPAVPAHDGRVCGQRGGM